MGYFFIKDNYKYWEKLENTATFKLKSINIEEVEKSLKKMHEELVSLEKEKSKKSAGLKQTNDAAKSMNEIYELDTKIKKIVADGRHKEEGLVQFNRIGSLLFIVTRLKDKYTRKEAIAISIQNNGADNGKVITSISNIAEDVYKLEQFGVYLTPPYADELAKIIMNNYYEMPVIEQEYIENDVPLEMITEFLRACYQFDILKYLDGKEKKYIDIPVSDFKTIHNDTVFRKYNLTDIKEALSIYGFSYTNAGRNDYTKANTGKVVRLFADKIANLVEDKK